jgi:hypothetical protein
MKESDYYREQAQHARDRAGSARDARVGRTWQKIAGHYENLAAIADRIENRQPYVMYPGTPYEHLMLPVTAAK